jgi:hypothetical protein
VDHAVDRHLPRVVTGGNLTERELHYPGHSINAIERFARPALRIAEHAQRIVTEHVAVESVTNLSDGLAIHQLGDPHVLTSHVVHQLANIPLGAWR